MGTGRIRLRQAIRQHLRAVFDSTHRHLRIRQPVARGQPLLQLRQAQFLATSRLCVGERRSRPPRRRKASLFHFTGRWSCGRSIPGAGLVAAQSEFHGRRRYQLRHHYGNEHRLRRREGIPPGYGPPSRQEAQTKAGRVDAKCVAVYAFFAFHPIQSSSHAHVPLSVRSLGGDGDAPLGNTTGLPRYASASR